MSTDVTMSAFQSEVEDSILSAPIVAQIPHTGEWRQAPGEGEAEEGNSYFSDSLDLLNEQIEDGQRDPVRHQLGDEESREDRQDRLVHSVEERLRSERPEVVERAETGREQVHQEQAQPQTLEEVRAGIDALDRTVTEYGLNDPQTAKSFSDDFCASLGTDIYKAGVNVEKLGSVMAKTALSAVNVYESTQGDVSKLGEIPAEAARAFSHDLLTAWGMDPRSMQVNEQFLAQTALGGMLNFIDTYSRYGGKVADLSVLNAPESAQLFFGNFLKALGHDGPVDRTSAVKFADACGKYVLGMLGKLGQIQDQRAAQARQGSKGQRGRGQRIPSGIREGIKGRKVQKFASNQDIFNESVMQTLSMREL